MKTFKVISYDNQYHGRTTISFTDRYHFDSANTNNFKYFIKVTASRPYPELNPYRSVFQYEILKTGIVGNIENECVFTYDTDLVSGPRVYEIAAGNNIAQYNMEYTYTSVQKPANVTSGQEVITQSVNRTDMPYDSTSWTIITPAAAEQYPFNIDIEFSTNMPIFNPADAEGYRGLAGDARLEYIEEYCINSDLDEIIDKNYYWIYNEQGLADIARDTVTEAGTKNWLSLKFSSRDYACLYYGADYRLYLKATNVSASYSLAAPGYILDHVPESSWMDGLVTDGPFYGTLPNRVRQVKKDLPDGQYMYGFTLQTNIPIASNEAMADECIASGDFSPCVNYDDITGGNTYIPPDFGDDELETIFGGGGGESVFSRMYIFTTGQLRTFSNKLFDNTTSVVEAILDGLKLYGANPIDVIGNLKYFPFDLTKVCRATTSDYIYFGSYLMENVPNSPVINMSGGGYIDCGTIYISPLFNSYRDFEPYTQLFVYLPYIGWQKVDISEIIGKSVNIRYYVDIITGRCIAVMIADGILIDYWNGSICADMMITATDARTYSGAALTSIFNGASQTVGGGVKGAEIGSNAGPYGAIAGAAIGTVGGAALGSFGTLFELRDLGLPKDHIKSKGSNTGLIGMNMPQYVIWRYNIYEAIEPDSFNAFNGRPSTASGPVSMFSGYLSCKNVNLNTSGMMDAEAIEVYNMLKNGIYI